ncbi:cellobiohydrolase-like protein II precursor [Tothia fuscella]|uniref:Glucanase n=1 Tax=Tothia fuscella TaxID=1048955 RepID=A0A9P4P0T3_9PEZI|nr:cellobiohydrolase-like protein II precursor [Tothia fuscella]
MKYTTIVSVGSLAAVALAKWDGVAPPAPTSFATQVIQAIDQPQVTQAPAAEDKENFLQGKVYANGYYSSEVMSLAIPSLANQALAPQASKVAKEPSFFWMDKMDKVPMIKEFVADAKKKGGDQVIPLVVYDLPDRDCSALASNGELSNANGGAAKYREYIAAIKKELQAAAPIRFVLVIEPDSLANLVTNMDKQKCAGAAANYRSLTVMALKELNLPNVRMYLDAGHGGWLGWDANLGKAAKLFADIYKQAGSPKSVRGLATNVANYNSWDASCASYTKGNEQCNEKRYIEKLGPELAKKGFPAHFIMDTSRNGVQPTKQIEWGNWCNVIGTGFGKRPTANTGNEMLDAFVWIKPGGECDGTSNTSAARYDGKCGSPDALKPAPEAGSWFQAYFEQLLTNAEAGAWPASGS